MRKRSKRATMSETDEQDWLSSLPDDILTHILSFLTTKKSVSTSALSTRWNHLFKSVPALHFDSLEGWCGFLKVGSSFRFQEFVNNVLAVHNFKCIKLFRLLHFHSDYINLRFLRSWIYAAISRNPQLLEMKIKNMRNFYVPDDLLTCRSLVHLKLSGCFVLGVIDKVCLPALKTFYINGCTIDNEDAFRTLFSSCPVLEDLTLYSCYPTPKVKFLAINVPSLKKLTIDSPLYDPCVWELNVPNLEYISCYGSLTKLYSVTVLESLREAYIDLGGFSGGFPDDRLMKLVDKFYEVQCLSLSGDSMESLGMASSCSLPMFNKLTTLELKIKYRPGWCFFPTLLEKSPRLELLVIHEDGFVANRNWAPQIGDPLHKHTIPLCFSQSLKEVKYCKCEGYEVEYQWFQFLLKNAIILEKLTVVLQSQPRYKLEHNTFDEEIAYMRKDFEIEKLYALPRSSNRCQITVEGPNGKIVCQEGGESSSPTSL